jgi:two-component system sensor histidine kinase FlrB
VVVLDRDGMVSESNPAAETLFGAAFTGRRWRDVVAAHFVPSSEGGPDACMRDGRRVSIVTRSLGVVPGQILLLTDVTETRELERRMRGLQRLSEMGRMMAKLAHQLRTPLAAALLDVSNLRASEPRSSSRRALHDRVLERLRHLEHLVGELLAFARQGRLEVEPLALATLLEGTRGRLAPTVEAGGARLLIGDVAPEIWVRGNATALASALESLVSNAVQAGGAGTTVRLSAAVGAAGRIALRVCDDGPGVAAGDVARIFEPFVTTRPDGNGLGLAVAHAIVEAHDGALGLERTGPDGSTFLVDLPAAQDGAA